MADDKIVTKKTTAKQAVTKKAKSIKDPVSASNLPPAASTDTTKSTSAKKGTRSTDKKAAATKPTPTKRGKSSSSTPAERSDHQGSLHQLANVSEEQRQDMIREAAYYKAEKRNFAPGHEAEDWAAAEREIDELIARARMMTGQH
ncbi:MAG: DUF2934 domain-containing protein [Thermochromatium sp.]